jgi:hypothetical protein
MGKRGIHNSDGPNPNMPAPAPHKQGDSPGKGRGVRDTDFSGNSMKQPKTLRGGIDQSGTTSFSVSVAKKIDGMRGHDTRRSHS